MDNYIISLPQKLKKILDKDQNFSVKIFGIVEPFSDILKKNDLFLFPEYTDHGIKHIENTLKYAENLIAEDTFPELKSDEDDNSSKLTPKEVGVMLLSVVLHDIGMHTNAEMFKNMIEGKYDNLVDHFTDGKTWKEIWQDFLYDSQYWGEEKKNIVFGKPDYNIKEPDLSDLQALSMYDRKLIGEFVRIHHCRIAYEVAVNGYIGRESIYFSCDGIEDDYLKMAGIIAKSHGMDVRDTFDYLESNFGDSYTPLGVHVVYLMVLLRIADYLQIDNSRTNGNVLKINTLYSHFSLQEHKTHSHIQEIQFTNADKERIVIQANPKDAQTYVKIEKLAEDIQKEFDRSWAILGEVYNDYHYKLRYRRITTNTSNEKYKKQLNYVPQEFGFNYNNDLFKLLIAPLYGDNPSFGVRELVQNAVDACRLCLNSLPEQDEPHVIVEVDSKKLLFTITDKGKGMNLYEIKNYFLTIGSSYNENIDWKKMRDKESVYRTGRFGIGILAAFLLGSELSVVTRKRNEKIGYGFTVSLHDRFIQINKVHEAEYGTRIEIKSNEKCIYRLKEFKDWHNWYVDKIPKVVYYFDGKPRVPDLDMSGYRLLRHSSNRFGPVYWRPEPIGRNHPHLYCNGFRISQFYSDKEEFSLSGFDNFRQLRIPSLMITDTYNLLPLNLKRDDIEANVKYDFEPELAKEVFIDIMCQLMATGIEKLFEGKELFNFHSEGFSMDSKYVNNFVREKGVIQISLDIIKHEYNTSKVLLPKLDRTSLILNNSKCFVQFSLDDYYNNDGIDSIINRINNRIINRKRYYYDIPNQTSKQIQRDFLYDEFELGFATIDDNTRLKQIFKNNFGIVLQQFRGWLIYGYNEDIVSLLKEIIILFGDIADWIRIKKLYKSTISKTSIDDLFEKYMGNDPVVPYEMEKRKEKFPLLFKDYSDIIEQYRKKKP